MKITWGTGIAIFFSCFVLFMLFMVYKTSQQDFDLVTEDYYAKEIAFQEVIDKTANYKALGEEVVIDRTDAGLRLTIPESSLNDESAVTLLVFRPSDDTMDRLYKSSGRSNMVSVPASDLVKGKYIIKLEWTKADEAYYFEKEFYY